MLVSTHGGHFAPDTTVSSVAPREIDATVQPLADRSTGGAGRLPLGLTPRRFILMNLLNEGLDAAGVDYEGPIIHAGAAETMIVVAVAKGLVRTDELEPGVEGEVSTGRLCSEGVRTITENSVLGDTRATTADAGETILERVTRRPSCGSKRDAE